MMELAKVHKSRYQKKATVVASAPGLLRFLGTSAGDNRGGVLQGAFDLYVQVAISKRNDNYLYCFSLQDKEKSRKKFSLKLLKFKKEDRWCNLIKGVFFELMEMGFSLSGVDCSLDCEIPFRIGLGASAAICVATVLAARELFALKMTDSQLIQCAYLAEHHFMENSKAMITDFITIYRAKANQIFYFDTNTIDYRYLSFPSEAGHLFLVNSKVPVQIDVEERRRRAGILSEIHQKMKEKKIAVLRDLDQLSLKSFLEELPETGRRFTQHIVQEYRRVEEASDWIQSQQIEPFGKLLTRSQESLRDNYELSCPEIDWLIKHALEKEGVLGARLIGKGLGGALILLLNADVDLVPLKVAVKEYAEEYEKIFGYVLSWRKLKLVKGAEILFSGCATKEKKSDENITLK